MTFELIGLIMCASIFWITSAEKHCPQNYRSTTNQCYRFIHQKRGWNAARQYCRNQFSGDLLTIKSHELKRIVWSYTKSLAKRELWIGAWDYDEWCDGTNIPESYWLDGEPSSRNEECIEVYAAKGRRGTGLNDEECGFKEEFACEARMCFTIDYCIEGTQCPWAKNGKLFGENKCKKCKYGYYSAGLGKGCKECGNISNCLSVFCKGPSLSDRLCKKCESGWYSGGMGEGCRRCGNVPNCHNVECSGPSVSEHRCIECYSGWYSGGMGNGCKMCTAIANCQKVTCTSESDHECEECIHNNVRYKLTNYNKKCDRMCGWKNQFCWPGSCGSYQLASACSCDTGFYKTRTDSETSCNPRLLPNITSCRTVVVGPNGEKKDSAANVKGSMACENMKDVYGNFKPTNLQYEVQADFRLSVSSSKPYYISHTHFGVTDFSIYVIKYYVSGSLGTLTTKNLKTDTSNGKYADNVWNKTSDFDLTYGLSNGEAICFRYQAKGGGHFTSKSSVAIPYDKTTKNQDVCYRFDNAPPKHCSENATCQDEPLQLLSRVTRKKHVYVDYNGWFDPYPKSSVQASQIEHFELRISEVSPAGEILQVDTSIVYEIKHELSSASRFEFSLTPPAPRLYSILLEVKDIADNIRQARRFLLFDNSTFLEKWDDNPFYVSSASNLTEYLWQTHHNDICLTWKERFYNEFYLNNPLLNPIEPDPHGLITGVYEQESGTLPVSGTPNVHGIIKYLMSWNLNDGPTSNEVEVSNFLHQNFCRAFAVEDGETYTFYLRPVDIVGNSLSENRTLHIDRSEPHINEVGLVKDDFKGLVVHDERDLSEMDMYFEALDPHSGILNAEWWFGIEDTGEELDSGVLGVRRIEGDCPEDAAACYCPDVGQCEMHGYAIPLNKLVTANKHLGDHHREYYFRLKTTNIAHLSTTEYVTVLVDYSPPEVGVIHEGSVDGKDVDYTSEDSILVHWYGFIDHESGISMYRIGFANRCLHRDELYNYKNVSDILEFSEILYPETSVRVNVSFTGKMYVSIIAFNNAMDPSDSVCSDGIIRDILPPKFHNLTLMHSSISTALICTETNPWILNSDMTLSQLPQYNACSIQCSEAISIPTYAYALPMRKSLLDSASNTSFCSSLPILSKDTLIYLPKDYIYLAWDIDASKSQIEDFCVGFGFDPSEADSPQLIAYMSTNRKMHFKHRYEGVNPGEIFYAFLKAVSKSGLEEIVTVGPMLIDSTPPLYKKKPDVSIDGSYVIISWDEDTFFDLEQAEQISRIEYSFGMPPDSNRFEWSLRTQESCSEVSCCCIKYPLANLQDKDTDLGLDFYAKLFVYNNAGHFVEIDTDLFKIPSRYPPGEAIVNDVDAEHILQNHSDIDVHFNLGSLCASWIGFGHQEDVNIEIGVGSSNTQADVVPFQMTDGSNPYCINASNIQSNYKYFFLVKASNSGGETLSASDGIFVLSAEKVTSEISVHAGFDCVNKPNLEQFQVETGLASYIQFDTKLELGGIFLITIEADTDFNTTISLNSDDILNIPENYSDQLILFATFVEQPKFKMSVEESTSAHIVTLTLYRCQSAKSISSGQLLTTYWKSKLDPGLFHIWYDVGIVEKEMNSLVSEYEVSYDVFHAFRNTVLRPSTDYQFSVKPCTNQGCLDAVFSDPFSIELEQPVGKIDVLELRSSLEKSCFDLTMSWKSFRTDSDILFYQWTISKDMIASHTTIPWNTVDSLENNEVSQCIKMQPHAYSSLFGCVKGFSLAGSNTMACKAVTMIRSGAYMLNEYVVYDLDYQTDSWKSVLDVVHSSDLGDGYRLLHESDLDVVSGDRNIAGAILGIYDRNVTWYLMTSKDVPFPDDCNHTKNCHFSTQTSNGYVIIPNEIIDKNTMYFICAHASLAVLSEYKLEEFSSCSNGFIEDDAPPVPLSKMVHVTNNNGFIFDTTRVIIRWNEFEDNVNTSLFDYPNNIRSYSYGIGNVPGKDDIIKFANTGHSTIVVLRDLSTKDGLPIYVTVKAFDYAGQESTIVSDELIVDTSPPDTGTILLEPEMAEFGTVNYITTYYITIHLFEFEDKESGISKFELGVGSMPFLNDIMPLSRYNETVIQLHLGNDFLRDGFIYFINTRAINNAGLSSRFVIRKFTIDQSPPTGGHVIDGHVYEEVDEDFSSNIYRIQAFWKGFLDPHSHIQYYRCGLGSQPFQDNIRHFINVGLNQAIEWTGPFIAGQTYYTTVEACNHAGLCRTLSSDGIVPDNSPPLQGIVKIGSEDLHQRFFPHSHWINIHWVGFEDPHTGIDHYDVCVGTFIGGCDIVQKFGSLLETNVIKTGLGLPVNTDLYATVTAYNRVGMNVSHTSDSFRIDVTPPEMVQKPRFLNPLTFEIEPAIQWEKSLLKLSWMFDDVDSPIISNEVTLLTHHEGHTPIEHLALGAENNYTVNLGHTQWLHNGDIYYFKVTACNAAGHCSTSQSNDLLIDSTPPHVGGFKKPLKWKNYEDSSNETKTNISLTWYGFHDQESGIHQYHITASRKYGGQELTGGVFIFRAHNQTNEYEIEIPLAQSIVQDELLILNIWAENQAGLMSSVARVSVYVLSATTNNDEYLKYGELEIEKHSCDIHFCNKDCTCAVFGQACIHFESNTTCSDIHHTDAEELGHPAVYVRFGFRFEDEQTKTPSSACLSGSWRLLNSNEIGIERYEWSMGLAEQPIGEGIFDLKSEQPWEDVGLREDITHCLPVNRSLIHAESYILYVRVWYTSATYATFQSNAIEIDQSAPSVRRGRFVKDSDDSCIVDFDFVDWRDTITGCWSGVFSEQQSSITHYTVSLGTLPHADDVFTKTNVGLETKIILSNLSLTHSTKYYFTVTAYNTVGLSAALTSDGFLVDTDNPIEGVVFNTFHWQNKEFQSSDSSISISWTGFADHFSGIYQYYVAVSESIDEENIETLNFQPVILKTSHMFSNMNLQQNKTYFGLVKASDAAGHFSNLAFSPGITVDITKPSGYRCETFDKVINSTSILFHRGESITEFSINITKDDLYHVLVNIHSEDYHIKFYINTGKDKSYLHPLRIHDKSFQFEHTFFADVTGERNIILTVLSKEEAHIVYTFSQCIELTSDDKHALSVSQRGLRTLSIDLLIADKESDLCLLEIGAGTTEGGFQVQSLQRYHHESNHAIIETTFSHGSPIYVTAIAENCAGLRSTFTAGPIYIDHTAPTLDDVHTSLKVSSVKVNGTSEMYHRIEGSWAADDEESGLKYCFCALETHQGSRDVAPFWEAGELTSCVSEQLKLPEGTKVHFVVKCVNNAELSTIYTTNPHVVTHVAPNTENGKVYILPSDDDNVLIKADMDTFVQTSKSAVKIGWSSFHDAAEISSYEYRLSFGGSPVVNWQSTVSRDIAVLEGLNLNIGRRYTAEVKATNTNGLASDPISADIVVLEERPRKTGKSVSISKQGNQVTLDWSKIFNTFDGIPVEYSLVIGTRKGYSDVFDLGSTTASRKTVTVPHATLLTPNPKELYIRISCSYPFGLEQGYEKNYRL